VGTGMIRLPCSRKLITAFDFWGRPTSLAMLLLSDISGYPEFT
jgi:hypothetical protein